MLIGAAIPAVFSAMLMLGVDKNAQRMVAEIHRQFSSIPGLREGHTGAKPEYDRCIDIATSGALMELIPPGLAAIVATVVVGFVGGPLAIGGFLLGNIVSGLLLALFMSNAGGLWDNAKKYVEAGHEAARAPKRTSRRGGRHRGRSLQGHRRPLHQHADHGGIAGGLADERAVRGMVAAWVRQKRMGPSWKDLEYIWSGIAGEIIL